MTPKMFLKQTIHSMISTFQETIILILDRFKFKQIGYISRNFFLVNKTLGIKIKTICNTHSEHLALFCPM